MNRRSFLKRASAFVVSTVAASTILDPDRILWVPGQKTFFLPTKPFIPEPDIAVPPAPERPALGVTLADDVELRNMVKARPFGRNYAAIDTGRFSFAGQVAGGFSSKDYMEAQVYAERIARGWEAGKHMRRKS